MTDTTDQHSEPAYDTQEGKGTRRLGPQNKWLLLAIGIVTLLAGFVALAMPFLASITAALLVGAVLIACGVVGLFTAFRRRDGWHVAASFALAVLSVIAGLLMLAQPLTGILALTTLLIAYFLASGILRIYYGAKAWNEGGGWMVATGVLSFLLAALVLFGLPLSAAWVPGVILGVDLVIWGILQIALAMQEPRSATAGL